MWQALLVGSLIICAQLALAFFICAIAKIDFALANTQKRSWASTLPGT